MLYLDSSAIVKLVAHEPETGALVRVVRTDPAAISSALAWTEVIRAVTRAGGKVTRAQAVLDGIALVPIDDGIIREAAMLQPSGLRTLDAIHLATALSIGDELDTLITYDGRLAEAASAAGIEVATPGDG